MAKELEVKLKQQKVDKEANTHWTLGGNRGKVGVGKIYDVLKNMDKTRKARYLGRSTNESYRQRSRNEASLQHWMSGYRSKVPSDCNLRPKSPQVGERGASAVVGSAQPRSLVSACGGVSKWSCGR